MHEVDFVAGWRPDAESIYKNVSAQKVAEEIYGLGEKPTVDEILEMARNENTEIHKIIVWDDTIAAEKYRKVQVRHIIRDIQIEKIRVKGEKKLQVLEVPVRMYHSIKEEIGYRPLPLIIQDEDLHLKLLRTAYLELQAFLNKYATLTELKPLMDEINRMIVELKIFDKVS